MKFEVIPDEQTPNTPEIKDVSKFIKAIVASKSAKPLSKIDLIIKVSCRGRLPIIVSMPTGDIIDTKEVKINDKDTGFDLYLKSEKLGYDLIKDNKAEYAFITVGSTGDNSLRKNLFNN